MFLKVLDGTLVEELKPCSEKRIEVQCDTCEKKTMTTFANYNKSQRQRCLQGKTYCRSCTCKLTASARRGKPAYNKGQKLHPDKKGKNHSSWKGGKYISHDGYIMIHVGGERGNCNWKHYRKEHMLIAELMLNRPLEKSELVHHIDGDKQNNKEENLWVTDQRGHRNAHCSLQSIGYDLVRNGLLEFINGEYRWKKNCMM